jgi:inosine-uridine nucleoside N-ribohydrolase
MSIDQRDDAPQNPSRRNLLAGAAALASSAVLARAGAATAAPRRVIIDTDPGVDDALAILLALHSPELKIEAITAVAGNVPLDLTLPNSLRLLEVARRTDIPVARGASRPLKRQLVTAPHAHGDNGLAGVDLPLPQTAPVAEPAAQLISRITRQFPGEVEIVAIGPLTNIALALQSDPQLATRIHGLTIMGGSLSGGNVTPAAEFNSYVDPEAAQIVYRSGARITMIGLDVTRKAVMTNEHIARLEAASNPAGRTAGRIMRATRELLRTTRANEGQVLVHDPMTVGALVDPSLVMLQDMLIEIETRGELTAGETVGYHKGPVHRAAPMADASAMPPEDTFKPNCRVALDVDAPRFLELLVSRLSRPA